MIVTNAFQTSNKNNWGTPQELFDSLDKEFCFTLDPCSDNINHKCEKHYTLNENGLTKSWDNEIVFMNPPYGKEISKWVEKANNSKGIIVGLLPARTDTKWFHNYVYGKAELRFIKGRIRFIDAVTGKQGGSPTFPSVIAIWRNEV